jgi:hypothetical protein
MCGWRETLHVSVCHTTLRMASKGRSKRHAQNSFRVLGMIAEPAAQKVSLAHSFDKPIDITQKII